MAPHFPDRRLQQSFVQLIARYPKQFLILLAVGTVVAIGFVVWSATSKRERPIPIVGNGKPATVLLCAWNVENFYDDHDDANIKDDLEDWFGNDPAAFKEKVDHLAKGLLLMNGGAGPDIACLCEVENERCMTALMEALNAKLQAVGMGDRLYTHVLFKGDNTGRHFAPGILTRLNVTGDRTRKLGTRFNGRILEGHINANGHELIVIAAHWTSRVSDGEDDGRRRLSYANDCYGRVNAILHENPDADIVVCGDFNDNFSDVSIQKGLRARDNAEAVRDSKGDPLLLDLFAKWDRNGDPPGTIHGQGKWSVFDHICVSRGLLDNNGWSCELDTAKIFAPKELRHGRVGEPFKFGRRNQTGERGYSDHFPVTVQLHVAGAVPP
jgi:endonuclease/exonuclease/phosphatase family metal-dependent hydrolase